MKRRELLGMLGAVSGASLVSATPRTQNRINLEIYIDNITGDKLSQSFYSGEKNHAFEKIMKKVESFYRQPELNLKITPTYMAEPIFKTDHAKRDSRNKAVGYQTSQKLRENIGYVIGTSNEDYQKAITEAEEELIKSGQTEREARKTIEDTFRENFKMGGGASFGDKTLFITPLPGIENTMKTDNEQINCFAYMVCHELGHSFGLGHLDDSEKRLNLRNNFMNHLFLSREGIEKAKRFDISINLAQINQIQEYLQENPQSLRSK